MATAAQRRMAATLGGLGCWARHPEKADRRQRMSAAHEGLRRKWIAIADPLGQMSGEALERAIRTARRAHMTRMALASSKARQRPDQAAETRKPRRTRPAGAQKTNQER